MAIPQKLPTGMTEKGMSGITSPKKTVARSTWIGCRMKTVHSCYNSNLTFNIKHCTNIYLTLGSYYIVNRAES